MELSKSRWVAYGALVTAVCSGIAIIITAVGDYQATRDPRARPDSFTPTDFIVGVAPIKQQVALLTEQVAECRRDRTDAISDLQRQLADLKANHSAYLRWRDRHDEWGQKLVNEGERWRGQIETEINFLKSYKSTGDYYGLQR